jgi:hypothetical protein
MNETPPSQIDRPISMIPVTMIGTPTQRSRNADSLVITLVPPSPKSRAIAPGLPVGVVDQRTNRKCHREPDNRQGETFIHLLGRFVLIAIAVAIVPGPVVKGMLAERGPFRGWLRRFHLSSLDRQPQAESRGASTKQWRRLQARRQSAMPALRCRRIS